MLMMVVSIACHQPHRRSNYVWGFCGQKIDVPLTEAIGRVASKEYNRGDGDHIIDIEPEEPYRRLLYERKSRYEGGEPKYLPHNDCCLHVEIESCEWEQLKGFWNDVKVGDRVRVKGVWTKDPHGHSWMEIHPVFEAEILDENIFEEACP